MQSALAGIERVYTQQLQSTRDSLAASGFTQSTRRANQENLLQEEKSSLVESQQRQLAYNTSTLDQQLASSQRDTQQEIQRLSDVATQQKTDLLRTAESQLGTSNLPNLNTDISPLGGITGSLPQQQLQDTLNAAVGFTF